MIAPLNENLQRKIKKNIYGKTQTIKAIFPPGCGATALLEVQFILDNLWYPHTVERTLHSSPKVTLLPNEIRITNIHMFSVVELMIRSLCLTDIQLIIFEGKTVGKHSFEKKCRELNWDYFLNPEMSLKIKVNSVASKAFHETALKESLSEILTNYISHVVSGEDTQETTTLYANLFKDRLTLSISLAGEKLYKRGYRGILSTSAPLREDIAACCIQKSLQFANQINNDFSLQSIVIPFSGTGTFAFEYLLLSAQFAPGLIGRTYALTNMPLFRQENFQFLLKKAREHCKFHANIGTPSDNQSCDDLHFYCIDHADLAINAFSENLTLFKTIVTQNNFLFPQELFYSEQSQTPFYKEDFLKIDIATWFTQNKSTGNIFLPLNPPYGIRLAKNSNSLSLYRDIAHKVNELSTFVKNENKNVLGFILCPTQETWSIFCKSLTYLKIETYHISQGGIDIRVCQFFI
jgi:23S rRNA G2445 N2-methylase RlmL